MLTEAGQKVFDVRYAMRDDDGNIIETFEQAVNRISRAAAQVEKEKEKWEREFAGVIQSLLFVPSTPIWANIGKPDRPQQPAACFVLLVEDSLESMYQTLKETALVFKSGGGVGYNFSSIRPKGSLVRSTKGRASGVVELIKLYDASSNMVMQGGVRRGASMGILNIDHPEIEDFIDAKLEGGLSNFNLSVGITDAFMEALEMDADWALVFGGEVHKVVRARELWEKIVRAAHTCGDPGVVFVDRLQKHNPVPGRPINTTNPCVTGDAWVMTDRGPRQVLELLGTQFTVILDGKPYRTGKEGFFKTGTKPVLKLRTKEGFLLKLTDDHLVMRGSEWVPVKDLVPGDVIRLNRHDNDMQWEGLLNEGEGYLLGTLIGNGYINEEGAVIGVWAAGNGAISTMGAISEYIASLPHRKDFKGWHKLKGRKEYLIKSASLRNLANKMGVSKNNKNITPEIEKMSSDGYRGFLRGLFDTGGTVLVNPRKGSSIRLSQSNLEMLYSVQRMLLRLGIYSKVYENRRPAGIQLLPDSRRNLKEYHVKANHELVISRESIKLFAERIGFSNQFKASRLKSLLKSYKRNFYKTDYSATVLSVEVCGIEDVYDVQVYGANAFDANGFYVHNCGEQPLSPGESCLLGSVNLARIIDKEGEIDWKLLDKVVSVAVRFLDNLIDIAEYPLASITEATRATRKIGLGFTGLADALIKARLPYDLKDGQTFAGLITRHIQKIAHDTSRELAEEKGVFPEWENSVFYPLVKRRNASCITIAPTGSVTAMAGCEGYGVEPIFAVAYTKSTEVAGDFEVFSPLFLEACKEHGVPREVLSEVARRGTCQGVPGIPEEIARIFKGAQDISPEDHILMQAEVQKYVDSAVSKTINMPNSATVQDIDRCYRMAYGLNLKGITVFRDGSKKGTVTVGKERAAGMELKRGEILPRPVSARGMTHRLDTGCGKIYLTVNHSDSGEILETFITTGSDGGCQVYTEATSRMISLAIRGGIPAEEIIGQLTSTHACPSYMMAKGKGKKLSPGKSCASAIAKKLEEIINGFRKPAGPGGNKCEVCGGMMNKAEGCLVCRDCGFSKC